MEQIINMDKEIKMKKISIIIVALLAVTGSLKAESVTQTNTFSGTPNYTSYLTFNKFDTLGGTRTLTGVNVSISLLTTAQGRVGVDNDGGSPASGTVTMGTSLNVIKHTGSSNPLIMDENGDGLSPIYATTSKSMSLAADDGDTTTYSTAGGDYDIMNVLATQSSSSIVIGSDYWVKYTGTGTFVFDATSAQSTDFSSFGGAQVQMDPMSSLGTVVVRYDFIPEPATASMMALVSGIGFLIRRRFLA
jgi:hypothetical protein